MLQITAGDAQVVAGAVVGSLAHSAGDCWSDLDLTFAVADGIPVGDVLEDWSRTLAAEFDAVRLFDLPSGPSIYRVFLLPGCLQFDLSFTPVAQFGATGPNFRLLFGNAVQRPQGDSLGSRTRTNCLATPCIMRCAPASASSAGVYGRRSTGSAGCATMR